MNSIHPRFAYLDVPIEIIFTNKMVFQLNEIALARFSMVNKAYNKDLSWRFSEENPTKRWTAHVLVLKALMDEDYNEDPVWFCEADYVLEEMNEFSAEGLDRLRKLIYRGLPEDLYYSQLLNILMACVKIMHVEWDEEAIIVEAQKWLMDVVKTEGDRVMFFVSQILADVMGCRVQGYNKLADFIENAMIFKDYSPKTPLAKKCKI